MKNNFKSFIEFDVLNFDLNTIRYIYSSELTFQLFSILIILNYLNF